MRAQEVRCFARMLECDLSDIDVFDLLASALPTEKLQSADMILLGGSGHYSAAGEGDMAGAGTRCAARHPPPRQANLRLLLGLSGYGPGNGRPLRERSAQRRSRHD